MSAEEGVRSKYSLPDPEHQEAQPPAPAAKKKARHGLRADGTPPRTAWVSGQSGNPRGTPRTAFQRGQSGNPAGLPEGVREVRALALQHGPEMVDRLLELARQTERPDLALAAAVALLDRAGAKPFSAEPDLRLEVTTHDSGNAREALAALVLRRLAGGGGASAAVEVDAAPGGGAAAGLAALGPPGTTPALG